MHNKHKLRPAMIGVLASTALALAIQGVHGQATHPAAAPQNVGVNKAAGNKAQAADLFTRARDAYNQGKYQDAKAANDQSLLLDPTNSDAQLLRRVLQSKLGEPVDTGTALTGGGTSTGKVKPLTTQQISMIRLMEVAPDDKNMRGSIPRTTLEEVWENVVKKDPQYSNITQQTFLNPAYFAAQAHLILDTKNPDYLKQVTVSSDPPDLAAFRTNVHTYVLQNCATSECHGGDKGGNFRLLGGGNTDPVLYTNFYIMSVYTLKSGNDTLHMIDRNNPENSIFLQFSLPKSTVGIVPHPGKTDPRRLANTSDPRYRAMAEWVRNLAIPQPNYGITYELPGGSGTPASTSTAPAASGAATAPARGH